MLKKMDGDAQFSGLSVRRDLLGSGLVYFTFSISIAIRRTPIIIDIKYKMSNITLLHI